MVDRAGAEFYGIAEMCPQLALVDRDRCFQRLDIERRRVQDVLALTERTDLLDEQPEKYMDQEQLNTLHEIEDKEESLLGHIGRLDELVAIFRDY